MKKRVLIILTALCFGSTGAFAFDKEFVGALGTSYAHDLNNAGLNVSAAYFFDFDPYFALSIEGDFFWLPWEKKLGQKTSGGVNVDVIASTNTFTFPLFFNGQVRLPFLIDKIYVEPNLTLGIGYAFMLLTYQQPAFTDSATSEAFAKESILDFYHGFAWQMLVGASFKPRKDSRIKFVTDLGYRGINTSRSSNKVDLSGILFRVGVLFEL